MKCRSYKNKKQMSYWLTERPRGIKGINQILQNENFIVLYNSSTQLQLGYITELDTHVIIKYAV